MRDRRYERRVPKTEVVDLHWQGNTGSDEQTSARLFDVSLSGACLVLIHPVRVASLVRFACEGRDRTASVRHCKRAPDGYIIGVEFEDTLA
jgi:PilZ domain-containing protein